MVIYREGVANLIRDVPCFRLRYSTTEKSVESSGNDRERESLLTQTVSDHDIIEEIAAFDQFQDQV